MERNKVVLIGSSHYHGLNLVRCFGEKGIRPYGIIVGKHAIKFVEASKYWERVFSVNNDEEAIKLLTDKFGHEKLKPVVIPWSDGAALELDRNYNKLKENFYLSSINNIEGEIGKWMNKDNQMEFAKKLGLPMSPTKILLIPLVSAEVEIAKKSLSLPLFLKPVASYECTKKDMRKINSWEELENYAIELKRKGFKRILVQEYMDIDKEYDFMGFCNKEDTAYTVAEKLRSWPANGGAASFARVIDVKEKAFFFDDVIAKLKDFGYYGPFDMDIFLVDNKIYFNEINWRSSANVYAALKSGNNYPYSWFLAVTQLNKELSKKCITKEFYFMNEIWDVRHVLTGYITLGQWIGDLKKSLAFAFWNSKDLKPFFVQFIGFIKNHLKHV